MDEPLAYTLLTRIERVATDALVDHSAASGACLPLAPDNARAGLQSGPSDPPWS